MTSSGDLNLKTIDGPGPVHIDVVAAADGLDTSGYTFAYVAGWAGGDLSVVRQAAETVTTAARTILGHCSAAPTTWPTPPEPGTWARRRAGPRPSG